MKALGVRGFAAVVLAVVLGQAGATPAMSSQFSHIKTWQNIYTATSQDVPFIKTHYDFIKLYPNMLVAYKDAGGQAPCWVYSNYHNITNRADYDFIRQWASEHSANWEDMFLHFAVDTTYRPAYESATKDSSDDNRCDRVFVYSGSTYTDRTEDAYSGSSFAAGEGVGWALYVASQEPFKEINVVLATAAGGWTGVWEYWNGGGWTALSPSDGTSGMTKSGKVEFMPPPGDWARNTVNGTDGWWVRLRTQTVGTTGPVVAGGGIKGRDYITFGGEYYTQPGWDDANDANGDGVRDGNVNPNASAIFRHESRVQFYEFGRTYLNMGNADARSAYAARTQELVTTPVASSSYTYDALFLDNATGKFIADSVVSGGQTVEDTSDSAWQSNSVLMLRAVKASLGPSKVVKINTGPYIGSPYEEYIDEVDAWHGEAFLTSVRPYSQAHIDTVIDRSARGKLSMVHGQGQGGYSDDERHRAYSLATFYLSKSDGTYYQFRRDVLPDQRFTDNWYAAIEYDIGQPLDPYYVLHQEDDPSCSHDAYGIARVYAREFERALVVSCTLPHWDSSYTPSYTVVLPAYGVGGVATSNRYRILHSDGSLDANVIEMISLRNSDGAILIKADLNPPDLSLRKVSESSEAVPGSTVTYTIFYENTSATETLFNVTLLDPVPSGTTYDAAFGTYHNQEVEPLDPDPYSDGKIIVALGNLVPGESGWVKFRVIVGSAP